MDLPAMTAVASARKDTVVSPAGRPNSLARNPMADRRGASWPGCSRPRPARRAGEETGERLGDPSGAHSLRLAVDLATVTHIDYKNYELIVADLVQDAVVARADP